MNNITYDNGFDCVWIASDKEGYLAAFFTAGQGPIPIQATKNEKLVLDDIESEVYKLHPFSDVDLHVSVKRPDDFIEMSKRGFFVYDWRDIVRTNDCLSNSYELVSSPKYPILIHELSGPIFDMAIDIIFSHISFREFHKINGAYLQSVGRDDRD